MPSIHKQPAFASLFTRSGFQIESIADIVPGESILVACLGHFQPLAVDPQLIAPDETINSIAAQRLLMCKLPVDSATAQKQVLPKLKLKRDLVTLKSLGFLKKE